MEVLLAKKRSREGPQNFGSPVKAGSRACVRKGREFEAFQAGDEGLVLSLDEESGTCQIRFDGSANPTMVAVRHLCGVASGNKKLSSTRSNDSRRSSPERRTRESPERVAYSSFVPENRVVSRQRPSVSSEIDIESVSVSCLSEKRVVSRQSSNERDQPPKSPARARINIGSPATRPRFNIVAKASWKEDGPSTPQARPLPNVIDECVSFPTSPSLTDSVTEIVEPNGLEASLRHILQQCSVTMSGCLRASTPLISGSVDMSGQQGKIITVDNDSYQQWHQSLIVLQTAVESCNRELGRVSKARRLPKARIEVPVETLANRQILALPSSPPRFNTGSLMVPTSAICRTPGMNRSWSGPVLHSVPSIGSVASPRSPALAATVWNQRPIGIDSSSPRLQNSAMNGANMSLPSVREYRQHLLPPSPALAAFSTPPLPASFSTPGAFTSEEYQTVLQSHVQPQVGTAILVSETRSGENEASRSVSDQLRGHRGRLGNKSTSFSEWATRKLNMGGGCD